MCLTLGDLGERKILKDIVPKFVSGVGDDCAAIHDLGPHVVITTDPVPTPAAKVIGGDEDLYWIGWLLVTINASDIAASGARPSSFVAAFDLPGTLRVSEFERLLQGVADSCRINGLAYVGGNLRESALIGGVGTAVGSSSKPPLSRKGASSNDVVVIFGEGGRFWADAEHIRSGGHVEKLSSPVFAPVSQAFLIHHLHERGLLTCAMDTSDGLAPSFVEMARVNHLGIEVSLDSMRTPRRNLGDRPERYWMGWGDWTVIAGVAENKLDEVAQLARSLGGNCTTVGRFRSDFTEVRIRAGNNVLALGRLESERFAADSWFVQGIDEYRRRLLNFPLPEY